MLFLDRRVMKFIVRSELNSHIDSAGKFFFKSPGLMTRWKFDDRLGTLDSANEFCVS